MATDRPIDEDITIMDDEIPESTEHFLFHMYDGCESECEVDIWVKICILDDDKKMG